MTQRFALPTRCFPTPLKATLRTLAENNVRGIQLDVGRELKPGELGETGLRHFRRLLSEFGVQVGSCAIPLRKPLFDEDGLDRRIEAIRSGMTLAYELGAFVLTARPGAIPDPETQPQDWKILTDVLNDLCAYGNHVGTNLCLTISPQSVERVKQLFSAITTGKLCLNFDPVACLSANQKPETIFREFHSVIEHIRARDAVRDVDGQVEETILGGGDVDWTEMVALIHEANYEGWIVLDRTSGDDQPRDLLRGLKFLQSQLPF